MTSVNLVETVSAFGDFLLGRVGPVNLATGLLLLGALMADRLLARRIGAGWRSLLFMAVLVRALLPLHIGFGGLDPLLFNAPKGTMHVMAAAEFVMTNQPAVGRILGAGFWAGLAYGGVAALLFGRWIWVRMALARDLRSGHPASPRVTMLSGRAAIWQHATLGPLVAGILRPIVVLPDRLVAESDDQALACILAHEEAHISRRDHLLQAWWQIICIAAWPVLPVWIAARQLRTLAELACDERAVAVGGPERRRRYGEILVALAEGHPPTQAHALVPSFGWELPRRLRALGWRRRWSAVVQGAVVFALTPVLVACTGTGGPAVPDARNAEASITPIAGARKARDPIVVVTKDGTIYLGKERVSLEAFETGLRQALAQRATSKVLLQLDPSAAALRVTEMMSAAKRSGATSFQMIHGPDRPQTNPGEATVSPGLDKDIISRVIRRHMNEVKYCYETELAKNPGLGGRIVIKFTIAATGQVDASTLQESTFGNRAVESCMVLAARRWEFPKPLGGSVVVSYPFTFVPNGAATDTREVVLERSPNQALILREVRNRKGAFKSCYESNMKELPQVSGALTLHFTVGVDGKASNVRAENDTIVFDQAVSCMIELVERWRFPNPTAPVDIRLPLAFSGAR